MRKKQKGVITYILNGDNALFIYKKRGHGKGWYNGPGGKINNGESPKDAACRETKEEIGVIPLNPELCGFIRFFNVDGEDWDVYIFRSYSFEGFLKESDEAKPVWFNKNSIPYSNMWEDDKYWLGIVLEGGYFYAEFKFARKKLQQKKIEELTMEEFYKKIKEFD